MMTCKEVSTLISTGQSGDAPLSRRIAVRLHVAKCRYCRAFLRQIEAVDQSARSAAIALEAEPSVEFESKVTGRLRPAQANPPK